MVKYGYKSMKLYSNNKIKEITQDQKNLRDDKSGLIGFILSLATPTIPRVVAYIVSRVVDDSGFFGEFAAGFSIATWSAISFYLLFITSIFFSLKGMKSRRYRKFAIAGLTIIIIFIVASSMITGFTISGL